MDDVERELLQVRTPVVEEGGLALHLAQPLQAVVVSQNFEVETYQVVADCPDTPYHGPRPGIPFCGTIVTFRFH